ncbi:enoyl-CoA hydratase [Blastocladiella britannica]|nr:enoyl-CoA hydratase [Blastocladiella britannica]
MLAVLSRTVALRSGTRALATISSAPEPFLSVTHDVRQDGSRTGVVQVAFNRPKTLNALTEGMGNEFTATMAELAKDASIRAMILTGEGRAFSAGGDLDFLTARMEASNINNTETMRAFYARFLAVRSVPFPTIAKINGPAVGAGFCLAMACDMRLAAHDAKVGFNFVKLGITPGMGAQTTVEMLTSPQVAARLLLTGDLISGTEAKDLGLVLEAHAKGEALDTAALTLARKIAAASPVAVRMTTKSLRLRVDEALQRGLAREADTQALCYSSPDFAEGMVAIKERRDPVFPLSASN